MIRALFLGVLLRDRERDNWSGQRGEGLSGSLRSPSRCTKARPPKRKPNVGGRGRARFARPPPLRAGLGCIAPKYGQGRRGLANVRYAHDRQTPAETPALYPLYSPSPALRSNRCAAGSLGATPLVPPPPPYLSATAQRHAHWRGLPCPRTPAPFGFRFAPSTPSSPPGLRNDRHGAVACSYSVGRGLAHSQMWAAFAAVGLSVVGARPSPRRFARQVRLLITLVAACACFRLSSYFGLSCMFVPYVPVGLVGLLLPPLSVAPPRPRPRSYAPSWALPPARYARSRYARQSGIRAGALAPSPPPKVAGAGLALPALDLFFRLAHGVGSLSGVSPRKRSLWSLCAPRCSCPRACGSWSFPRSLFWACFASTLFNRGRCPLNTPLYGARFARCI